MVFDCIKIIHFCFINSRGKFGQRPDSPKTKILSERRELLDLLIAPGITVTCIIADLGDKVIVTYRDENSSSRNTNSVIAAVTCAHARVYLYKLLDKLQDRVLYFDTGNY
jgi:hypothetical protein